MESRAIVLPAARPVLDIDAIYAEHAPFISRVLIRLVGDGAHIDDLIQETFLVAYRKRDTFDGRSAVRTWLYAIASRLAMRHRRGVGRFLRALDVFAEEPVRVSADPQTDLERMQAATLVRSVLDRLPFKQREVVVLYELEEIDGAEIADILAIPINTVWTRLHHARKELAATLRRERERGESR